MRRKWSIILGAMGCSLLGWSWFTAGPERNIGEAVQQQYRTDLQNFADQLVYYQQIAGQLNDNPHYGKALQKVHQNTRLAYKRIEFLIAYIDPQSVKNHLNGAPLPSLAPNVPDIAILEPEGLQVLDELIFSEEPHVQKDSILFLIERLRQNYQDIHRYQAAVPIEMRHALEACRKELVRIFTLGLTGFDTPASKNAIPEVEVALKSTHKVVRLFYPLLEKYGLDSLAQEVETTYQQAFEYLNDHTGFEDFDRLGFLIQFINPLYRQIYQVHTQLGIETIEETTDLPQHVNYHATNIFANDFLNASAFVGIDQQDWTPERVALGKLLFYDPILSSDNTLSCASCHHPKLGFADGKPRSLTDGKTRNNVSRNSPGLINSIYADKWFYDLRLEDLHLQMQHVIFNKNEFNTNFETIIQKLSENETYKKLFEEAYSDLTERNPLSPWFVQHAITSYLASLRSFNSPVDRYIRGESDNLPEAAKRGFNLFMGKAACGTCHFAPTFYGTVPPDYMESESEVLGVPAGKDTFNVVLDADPGRYASGNPSDRAPFYKYAFKTSTVRNVALTAPYMHNGVYDSLEEVVDFYKRGGGVGLGLDLPHQTLPFDQLDLNEREIKDLVVFMEHLTDTVGMTGIPVVPR